MDRGKDDGLILGRITDADVEMMRRRIGYPNPTLRKGYCTVPWNPTATADCIRRWAISMGDSNSLYYDPAYAAQSRWGGAVAPPGFEWSMGWDRTATVPEDLFRETRSALRGVQLYHSGAEYLFHRPITDGTELFKAEWVEDVEAKASRFGNRSLIVNNANCFWDKDDTVYTTSSRWFVHVERRPASETKRSEAKDEPAHYTKEQIEEIEATYDAEYIRGSDTLYFEDVAIGDALPTMVKGPLTITDMVNFHMGAGWLTYGNPPYRLAYENRKKLKGFYSRNEFNAWDTLQRVHWDMALAHKVGVQATYDIGPMRYVMVCHYLTNFAGDDAWVQRIRYELRNFNYMGDTTWLTGTVTDRRVDPLLGPLIEVRIVGKNQRGQENITADATILVASRERGAVALPPPPPVTPHRRAEP